MIQFPFVAVDHIGHLAPTRLPRGSRRGRRSHPAIVIDGPIAQHLEVLSGVSGRGVGVRLVERIGHAHAFDGLLSDPVHHFRGWNAGDIEDRGHDIDQMVELGANAAGVFDPLWPSDDHTLPRAAEMGGDLFGPLERRIERPGPRHRHMWGGHRRAPDIVVLQLFGNRHIDALRARPSRLACLRSCPRRSCRCRR